MALKNLFRRNKIERNTVANETQSNNDWDMKAPGEVEAKQETHAEKQQNKIIMALMTSIDGHPDMSYFSGLNGEKPKKAQVSQEARDFVLDGMARGDYDVAERELIDQICGPLDMKNGAVTVIASLNERKSLSREDNIAAERINSIMAYIANNQTQEWGKLEVGDVEKIHELYPSPYDFEPVGAAFLDQIEKRGGATLRREY